MTLLCPDCGSSIQERADHAEGCPIKQGPTKYNHYLFEDILHNANILARYGVPESVKLPPKVRHDFSTQRGIKIA